MSGLRELSGVPGFAISTPYSSHHHLADVPVGQNPGKETLWHCQPESTTRISVRF